MPSLTRGMVKWYYFPCRENAINHLLHFRDWSLHENLESLQHGSRGGVPSGTPRAVLLAGFSRASCKHSRGRAFLVDFKG